MIPRERQSKILHALEAKGSVAVSELATHLAVTDETIRRDLAKLADEGLLVRTHGGATMPDPERRDAPFAIRRSRNVEAKRTIAREAARLVQPGDVVGIDASTTGFELARQLPLRVEGPPITVVSNGLDVIKVLAGRPGIQAYSTGGLLDEDGTSFIGPIAESTFQQFALRRVFLSCKAYDPERGPSEASPAHAAIKQAMLNSSEQSVLLVDTSKIGERASFFVADPDRFSVLITDETALLTGDNTAAPRVVVATHKPTAVALSGDEPAS